VSLGRVASRLKDAGPPDVARQAIQPLLGLLERWEFSPVCRAAAAAALGLMQMNADEVVPALCRAMEDDNLVHSEAAHALGRFGGKAQTAVEPLLGHDRGRVARRSRRPGITLARMGQGV